MEEIEIPPITTTAGKSPLRKFTTRRIIIYILLAVCLLLTIFVSYYIYSLYSFAHKIYEDPIDNIAIATASPGASSGVEVGNLPVAEPPEWNGDERINILLLGGDTRGIKTNAKPRSDTMMIISIDPIDKSTRMFSLLRDMYVAIPNHGSNRLNAAITMGGPLLSIETISNLIDLPIQYYVYTDFEGFISLIDALGGIEIDVEKNMTHTDSLDDPRYNIKLKKGLQELDGLTALQYVRFRSDALSDFARSDRQRTFLSAIADKMKSTTSLLKLPQVLNSIAPYMETNIPPSDMIKLARLGLKLDLSQIAGIQIPPNNAYKNQIINDMDVLVVEPQQLKSYVKEQLAN